ncbi:MAG: CinA family protein [Rhodobacteraceae bacterium]|nr:CinA family protein [Paracoccaceae bacterium]
MTHWERLSSQAEKIIKACSAANVMVATAESCTGGLIAGVLTEISGSSAVVDRGFVTYSNEAKMEMIGVSSETLTLYGAVSAQTAMEMADGALERSNADIAVAVTGIAGPGGGSAEKPVGTVHLAIAKRNHPTQHQLAHFGDVSRDTVRLKTVEAALILISNAI